VFPGLAISSSYDPALAVGLMMAWTWPPSRIDSRCPDLLFQGFKADEAKAKTAFDPGRT
jgi:hypothetical protein